MVFLLLLDDPVDDGNGVYHVSLRGQQIMECALEFQPSEVQTKWTFFCQITLPLIILELNFIIKAKAHILSS